MSWTCSLDTGNPFPLIVSLSMMAALKLKDAAVIITNFGTLLGGWFQLAMPDLSLTQTITGYASDDVVVMTAISHADFQGLAGLPLLGLLEFGGDATEFWIRRP